MSGQEAPMTAAFMQPFKRAKHTSDLCLEASYHSTSTFLDLNSTHSESRTEGADSSSARDS
jgi:hypothetical protein